MEDYGELKESKDWSSNIGKIKKGDKIVVTILSEPLQEKYNAILACREDFGERLEKIKTIYSKPEDMPMEVARELITLNYQAGKLRDEFWYAVNDQYSLWKLGAIGIRNGYCIVKTIGPEELFNRFKTMMDEFMDEVNGEDSGGA